MNRKLLALAPLLVFVLMCVFLYVLVLFPAIWGNNIP